MPDGPRTTKRWPVLTGLAWLAAGGGLVQVLLAWSWRDQLGDAGPALLAAHYLAFMAQVFSYHAGLAMFPVLAFAAWRRRGRLMIVAATVGVLGAGPELLSARPRGRTAPEGGTLRLMSANLMYGRTDAPRLLAQIARERPDVVLFQEWTPAAARDLKVALLPDYPHSVEVVRDDAFGQAVFSRRPFAEPERLYAPANSSGEPAITVALDFGGRVLRVTDLHTLPPVSLEYFAAQRRTARELAAWVSSGNSPVPAPDVIMGDFNATPRTAILRALRDAGMRDAHSEAGWWRGTTWPRRGGLLPLAPGLQLDHALVGPRAIAVRARTGEDFGSDHRPVIVDLAWK